MTIYIDYMQTVANNRTYNDTSSELIAKEPTEEMKKQWEEERKAYEAQKRKLAIVEIAKDIYVHNGGTAKASFDSASEFISAMETFLKEE
jgi:hypothetical protein